MADPFKRLRGHRQRAVDALAAINVQMDILKDAVGAWGAEMDALEVAPRQKRPMREPSKYVTFVDELAELRPDGWVSLDDALAAMAKAGETLPTRGNLKKALDAGVERGFLEVNGESYRPISD